MDDQDKTQQNNPTPVSDVTEENVVEENTEATLENPQEDEAESEVTEATNETEVTNDTEAEEDSGKVRMTEDSDSDEAEESDDQESALETPEVGPKDEVTEETEATEETNDGSNTAEDLVEEEVSEDEAPATEETENSDEKEESDDAEEETETSETEENEVSEDEEESSSEEAENTEDSASENIEVTNETGATEGTDDEEAEQLDENGDPLPAPHPMASDPSAKWYVVHVFAGHENKVLTTLHQRIEAEHLEHKIFQVLVPTQDKIEIKAGKKATVKEKIFPGYILVKMILDDDSWLAVRTTQGVTSFIGMGNKPTPISEKEVSTIINYTSQGAAPTFKDVFMIDDTVKIVDGPFAEFIGKVDSVDKEKGRVRVLVSIFGRETPVELDFLQVQKL